MKNKYIHIILLSVFLISSCTTDPIGLDEEKDKGKILVCNAAVYSSAAREVGFWVNYNGTSFIQFPLRYSSILGYQAFLPGNVEVRLDSTNAKLNIPPTVPKATVATVNIPVLADHYYSLFLTGTDTNMQPLLLTDDLSLPSAGNCKIRFLNLSPDAGAIDIVNRLTGEKVVENLAFRAVKEFVEIPAATLELEIRETGTTNVLSQESGAFKGFYCYADNIYTFWVRGYRLTNALVTPPNNIDKGKLEILWMANRWKYPL